MSPLALAAGWRRRLVAPRRERCRCRTPNVAPATRTFRGGLRVQELRTRCNLRNEAECNEEDWRPWHRMGLIHEKKEDDRSACVAFRNAARIAPHNHRPLRALARVLKSQNKLEEAQAVFAEAQRLALEEERVSTH